MAGIPCGTPVHYRAQFVVEYCIDFTRSAPGVERYALSGFVEPRSFGSVFRLVQCFRQADGILSAGSRRLGNDCQRKQSILEPVQ
jgi:hypothetical protein